MFGSVREYTRFAYQWEDKCLLHPRSGKRPLEGSPPVPVQLDARTHQKVLFRAVETRLKNAEVAEGLGASIDRPRCGAHCLRKERSVVLVGPKSLPRLAIQGTLELPIAELVSIVLLI